MNELIGKSVCFLGKNNNKKTKCEAYKVNTVKLEFENEKMNRVNFHLVPNYHFLKELNIKLCTKNKDLKTVYSELCEKTRNTVSENNFMKEAINIIKQIDKKINIAITPIIYNEKSLFYHVKIGEIINSYEWNNSLKTIEILNKWNLYKDHKDAIDFYLNVNLKNSKSKELSKLLFDDKDKVTLELIKETAKELSNDDKKKLYKVFDRIISEESKEKNMRFFKYYKLFKYRAKYIKLYNELDKSKLNKFLVNKWLKEEFYNPFLVSDPSEFDMIFKLDFDSMEETKKNYIEKIENTLKRFWNETEKNINNKISDFKIALCKFDLLLNEFYIKAIGTNKMKDYVLSMNDFNKCLNDVISDFNKENNE